MNKLIKQQKCILILLLVGLFCVLGFNNIGKIEAVSGNVEKVKSIEFSAKSGFYANSIVVKLEADAGRKVYYTLDGSLPSMENPSTCLYEEGILLEATEQEVVYTIKAVAWAGGEMVSDVESRTFVLGTNINHRYSTLVLAISGSPEDFYSYENGILVHGRLGDEYMNSHPEWSEFFANDQIPIIGNRYQRGAEAEKEVAMTLFDAKGNPILSQNCGLRIYGAVSRMKNQPSFRLYARSEYDEINDFDYAFFADQYTEEDTLVSEHKRVIVRNGGNDNGYGFIRSELATRIAKEAGFRDAPSATPVCVYMNGNYYGIHWFITNFDDNYFRETYGEYPGEMYIFEGEIQELEGEVTGEDPIYAQLDEAYEEQIRYLETADLTQEENWQRLNAFMDVEDFLQYIAIHHYVANEDCLYNNYRAYRYYSPNGEYTPGTVFDGKYRFLLFDLDFGLGLIQEWSYEEPEKYTLTAERIDGNEAYEKLFSNILKREDCRQLYMRYTLSLMNYYYSEEHVKEKLEKMHGSRALELQYMVEQTDLLLDNHAAPDVTNMDYIAHQMFLIERFAKLRPTYVKEDLQLAFGNMKEVELHVSNPEGASITVDYATFVQPEYVGDYFEEVPVTISAKPKLGYRFKYWLVNERKILEAQFLLDDVMIADGRVKIVCVCAPTEDADLCITGVKMRGGDFIQITNLSTEGKDLGKYCLTDNASYRKSALPTCILNPGETITIYCKNYVEVNALGHPLSNFNVKAGETVSLYRTDGYLVDSVTVPQLGSLEGIWQRDMATGAFKEVILQ